MHVTHSQDQLLPVWNGLTLPYRILHLPVGKMKGSCGRGSLNVAGTCGLKERSPTRLKSSDLTDLRLHLLSHPATTSSLSCVASKVLANEHGHCSKVYELWIIERPLQQIPHHGGYSAGRQFSALTGRDLFFAVIKIVPDCQA